jgi:hypothetical protein
MKKDSHDQFPTPYRFAAAQDAYTDAARAYDIEQARARKFLSTLALCAALVLSAHLWPYCTVTGVAALFGWLSLLATVIGGVVLVSGLMLGVLACALRHFPDE